MKAAYQYNYYLGVYQEGHYGDGEAVGAMSPEARIESFVEFVRRKINNQARFKQAEVSIKRGFESNVWRF